MANRHGLELRAAAASDAPGLADMLRETGRDHAPHDLAERLDRLRALNGAALIAVEWGPPSGVVLLHWYQSLTARRPTALITALYVAQDARRRGIGRLLVKAASQAARAAGCETLLLADAGLAPSMADFCAATGFTPRGTLAARNLRKKGDVDPG